MKMQQIKLDKNKRETENMFSVKKMNENLEGESS
jgi:hypothetical protein